MAAVVDRKWSSRSNKRSLSIYEKESILSSDNIALVLPGSLEGPNEIAELIDVGFKKANIVGFEEDPAKYKTLISLNKQNFKLVNSKIQSYLVNLKRDSVSYIHLDLMASIKREMYLDAKYFSSIMSDNSRFRITVSKNLFTRGAGNYQSWCIKNIAYFWFLPLCEYLEIDENILNLLKDRINYHFGQSKYKDPPLNNAFNGFYSDIGIAMFLFVAFMLRANVDPLMLSNIKQYQKYFNLSSYINNNYSFSNINKVTYSDSNYKMLTVWFDIDKERISSINLMNNIIDIILMEEHAYVYK